MYRNGIYIMILAKLVKRDTRFELDEWTSELKITCQDYFQK